ncbi:hypothetical protein F5050DRAFT_1900960 [Lentinula boryana]|uniref:Uncharacterized protein n=1 Tax=Lentinula boryana TaxID=40481 RepID=A0ABQ8QKS0_9AGAR|nr:hypothetical protein F5050DRAFT_1900960 [Lentinula boryana]
MLWEANQQQRKECIFEEEWLTHILKRLAESIQDKWRNTDNEKAELLQTYRYGELSQQLAGELLLIVDMIIHEYITAPSSRRKEMLCHLEGRLSELFATMTRCEQLVNLLNGRNKLVAFTMSISDHKKVKILYQEVKIRGEDIEHTTQRGITRLKTFWPECRYHVPGANDNQSGQNAETSNRDSPSPVGPAVIPSSSTALSDRSSPIYTITPTHTMSHAVVNDSAFNSVGGHMYNTTFITMEGFEVNKDECKCTSNQPAQEAMMGNSLMSKAFEIID